MARQRSSQFVYSPSVIISIAVVVVACCQGCAGLQRACIYRPARFPEGDWQPAELAYEDAWFQAEDGTRLHGWFVPCEHSRTVILFAHGIEGNVTTLTPHLKSFCDRHHAAVMVFDYRGYGRSEGKPSEEGLYQDARAARKWLAARTNLPPQDIVLMGRSLGAAVMVELAATEGARGLILESAFTTLPDVVSQHAWGLPCKHLMACQFDSLGRIGNYHGPLLICHGELDRLISIDHAKQLFERANQPKRFVSIPGADHQDPPGEDYHRTLDDFLARLPNSSHRFGGGVARIHPPSGVGGWPLVR